MSGPRSSILSYLEFYRDLGVKDLYLPDSASTPRATQATAAVSQGTLAGKLAPAAAPRNTGTSPVPEPRTPADLFAAPKAERTADALPILQGIRSDIGDCKRCRLHEGRTNIVFGVGNPNAKLVFVGEGPGADEDAQGIPFVGRAGQLLTQMINNTAKGEGVSIERQDVYICNVVKCRPPGNRAPEPDEMEMCGQFLDRQLDAMQPKAICVLGGTAAKYLLKTSQGITRLRGQWQEWRGIPVMPTYHPSFLLRPYNQDKKREAWEDLKKLLHYVYD
jgi:DNA polymerase